MWSAIALFAVEFVGLFSGLSMFASGYNTLSTALHFTGMVLVGLFVNQVRHRRGGRAPGRPPRARSGRSRADAPPAAMEAGLVQLPVRLLQRAAQRDGGRPGRRLLPVQVAPVPAAPVTRGSPTARNTSHKHHVYTSTSRSAWRPRPVQASLQHTHPPAGHARRDAVACSTCSRVFHFHCIDPPLPAAEREADGWTSCPRRICEDAWPSRGQRAAPSHALSPPSSRPDHRPTPSRRSPQEEDGQCGGCRDPEARGGSGPGSPGPVSATADGHCPSFVVFPL